MRLLSIIDMKKFETDIKGVFQLFDNSLFSKGIPKEHWAHCNLRGLRRQDSHLLYLFNSNELNIGDLCKAELRFKFRDDKRFKYKLKVGEVLELNIGSVKYGELKIIEILNQNLHYCLDADSVEIISNKQMSDLIDDIGYDFLNHEISISENLQSILYSDFTFDNDMVTLKLLNQMDKNPVRESNNEKSELEYRSTKIYIEEFVDQMSTDSQLLKIGLEYIKKLSVKLINEFSKDEFVIILSFSEIIDNNENVKYAHSCSSRFFKKRDNNFWFNCNDLNSFKNEALIVIKTKVTIDNNAL